MSKKITLEEAKKRVFEAHGDQVRIVEESYYAYKSQCSFIDIEYGEWTSYPNLIGDRKYSHPARKQSKIEETCLKIFGTKNYWSCENAKEKQKKIMIEKYGVENPSQSKEIQLKKEETMMKNHGVKYALQSDLIKSKIDWNKSTELCHKTKKRNGSFGKSIQEDKFYKFLLTIFETNDIERQYRINSWNIDFYIKSKQLFIQFDGEYYHGLDRSLEEIKLFKNLTDKNILLTYETDLKQNQWFKENNLKLFRVICGDYKKLNFEKIKEKLLFYQP